MMQVRPNSRETIARWEVMPPEVQMSPAYPVEQRHDGRCRGRLRQEDRLAEILALHQGEDVRNLAHEAHDAFTVLARRDQPLRNHGAHCMSLP